ncbi:unnamed protein product [Gulo gulo]|uniref:Uncharacterized protein n=1 Tax=Gulo gulo TaxID=48420 RepID=A0A9X9PSV2_GULGU|nr:unnamed protein product [Gulo gulo]
MLKEIMGHPEEGLLSCGSRQGRLKTNVDSVQAPCKRGSYCL